MPSYTETIIEASIRCLEDASFDIEVGPLPGGDSGDIWVLAENESFLVGLVVVDRLARLAALEPTATAALLERIKDASPEAKQWDVYLLLVSPESARSAADLETVAAITRSLRGIRRLVGLEVASSNDVRRVLAPFVPLAPPAVDFEVSALDALQQELSVNGVDAALAQQYLDVFRNARSLRDI